MAPGINTIRLRNKAGTLGEHINEAANDKPSTGWAESEIPEQVS